MYAYLDDEDRDMEDTRPLIRPNPVSYVDNRAIFVSKDATTIILRTDYGVYAEAAGDGGKRVQHQRRSVLTIQIGEQETVCVGSKVEKLL